MRNIIKYIKHNKVRFNSLENREKGTRLFIEFFDSIIEQAGKEMKGHMILESITDLRESIVLTFWETKEDMDKFYSPQNKVLTSLVERAQPLFEKVPERTDHAVSDLSLTIT